MCISADEGWVPSMAASWHLQMDGLIGGSVNGWLVQMIHFLLGPKGIFSGAFFC